MNTTKLCLAQQIPYITTRLADEESDTTARDIHVKKHKLHWKEWKSKVQGNIKLYLDEVREREAQQLTRRGNAITVGPSHL